MIEWIPSLRMAAIIYIAVETIEFSIMAIRDGEGRLRLGMIALFALALWADYGVSQ